MMQDKTQSAKNGRVLSKDCNAVLSSPGDPRLADRGAATVAVEEYVGDSI